MDKIKKKMHLMQHYKSKITDNIKQKNSEM